VMSEEDFSASCGFIGNHNISFNTRRSNVDLYTYNDIYQSFESLENYS
jgi:hypothetical protein